MSSQSTKAVCPESAGIVEVIESMPILCLGRYIGFALAAQKFASPSTSLLIAEKKFEVLLDGKKLNGTNKCLKFLMKFPMHSKIQMKISNDAVVEVLSEIQRSDICHQVLQPNLSNSCFRFQHEHTVRVVASNDSGGFHRSAEKFGLFTCEKNSENSIKYLFDHVVGVEPVITVILRFHPNSLAMIRKPRTRTCGHVEIPYVKHISKRKMSDLTIVCGDTEFQVHQTILKCVSQVFERMLAAGMSEATTGRVVIDDMEAETVEAMLNYIYKGQFKPRIDQSLICLTYCADKYALIDLKRLCFLEMAKRLSLENAASFVMVASLCGTEVEDVKVKIIDFCKKNFAALSAKSEFQDFVRSHVEVLF